MTFSDSTAEVVPLRAPEPDFRVLDAVAIFFFSIVTGTFGVAIGGAIGGTGSYAETIGSLLGLWAGIVPGLIFVSRARGTGNLAADFGLRFELPSDLRGVLYGLGAQFVVLPLLYVVVQLFSSHDLTKDLEAPAKELTDNAHGIGFWILAVLLIVGAPLVEELFYRGLLLRALKRSLPVPVSIIVCGVVFGAVHFDLITLPGLAVFGMILAWLSHRSGRLGPNVIAHAAFNAATVVALWHG